MRSCIAVLTRGYSSVLMYSNLIRRNKAIQENLTDKTTDILIFHEGNITIEHQTHIADETPDLRIMFVDVNNGHAFKSEKTSITFHPGTSMFGIGYRHMCSFWFVDFWYFVTGYDRILRIDEDCYIDFNIDAVLAKLDNYNFICGRWMEDVDFVVIDLNKTTLDFLPHDTLGIKPFLFENAHSGAFSSAESDFATRIFNARRCKDPAGPYTNVFALNLQNIRTHQLLSEYIKIIEDSGNIYRNRWGDLPLWGEAIHYLFGMKSVLIDTNIRYLHESHDMKVNY